MTTFAIKSRQTNFLEGLSLTAALQAFPTLTASVMLMKLFGSGALVKDAGGAVLFIATTSMLFALLTGWLGPKHPAFFKNSYAPVFFDDSLRFREKVLNWLAQPSTQQQMLIGIIMLALLGVAMVMRG